MDIRRPERTCGRQSVATAAAAAALATHQSCLTPVMPGESLKNH